ncbi:ArsR family transcriptional regulator [Mycobacteroides abscessus]|nr:ArsR family transcriptional regulator [Mycobacteroides abscessus subsp. massiliense]PVA72324.1 transcriptional regulator [Mycobacteroides abscessus]RIS03995.1 ArsR family transcriptional regulator [Mycobacteroides abscessus]RIS11360.1 ArsR family transcriptional regulator [Mycobacteroides abscessus]RIS23647.1 ArsR family transcriptional regulator [Mycobacteroides abscessus]
MAAIAQSDGLVNPTELQLQLGFTSQSFLQSTVSDLVSIGLLSRQHGGDRVFYRRNPHSLWAASLELLGQALTHDVTVDIAN